MNQGPALKKSNSYIKIKFNTRSHFYNRKVGLMNQTPTKEKLSTYIRKIKTAQFIYIIEKVGLMNQAPKKNLITFKNSAIFFEKQVSGTYFFSNTILPSMMV